MYENEQNEREIFQWRLFTFPLNEWRNLVSKFEIDLKCSIKTWFLSFLRQHHKRYLTISSRPNTVVLKSVLKKIERLNFDHRMGVHGSDTNQLQKIRDQCQNRKLRHMHYRLVGIFIPRKECLGSEWAELMNVKDVNNLSK